MKDTFWPSSKPNIPFTIAYNKKDIANVSTHNPKSCTGRSSNVFLNKKPKRLALKISFMVLFLWLFFVPGSITFINIVEFTPGNRRVTMSTQRIKKQGCKGKRFHIAPSLLYHFA